MKNTALLLILILSGFSAYCQDTNPSPQITQSLSDAEFIKAKEGYLKMSKSELYNQNQTFIFELVRKIQTSRRVRKCDFMDTDESYKEWISDNLAFTQFKNVEEAIELRKKCLDSTKKIYEEYLEIFDLLQCASTAQVKIILEPDFKSARELYGR